jgi:hypothetical protein
VDLISKKLRLKCRLTLLRMVGAAIVLQRHTKLAVIKPEAKPRVYRCRSCKYLLYSLRSKRKH